MNLLFTLIGRAPKWIVMFLLVVAFVVSSHAGLDALVTSLSDSCVAVDSSNKLCLIPSDVQ
jgi:hypothetical protein